jgi:hypothetical protein
VGEVVGEAAQLVLLVHGSALARVVRSHFHVRIRMGEMVRASAGSLHFVPCLHTDRIGTVRYSVCRNAAARFVFSAKNCLKID